MRFLGIAAILSAFALGSYGVVTNPTLVANIANVIAAADSNLQDCLSAISREQGSTLTTKDISVTRAQINTDEEPDYLLQLSGDTYCGTTGCVYEICINKEGTATKIAFGYAAQGITVAETITNGMHSLVLNSGVTLEWDGERYSLADTSDSR